MYEGEQLLHVLIAVGGCRKGSSHCTFSWSSTVCVCVCGGGWGGGGGGGGGGGRHPHQLYILTHQVLYPITLLELLPGLFSC